MGDFREEKSEYTEKVVQLSRVSKAIKGGRKMSFAAMVIVGDGKGKVGYGLGKAGDVSEAIRKGAEHAKRSLITVPMKNGTLPHEVRGKFKGSDLLLKPAAPGTGIIAGGSARAVLELAGVKDILSKSMGSRNTLNVVRAVFEGFNSLIDAKKVSKNRGKSLNEMWG